MTDTIPPVENSPEKSAAAANVSPTASTSLEKGQEHSCSTKIEVTNYVQGLQLYTITIAYLARSQALAHGWKSADTSLIGSAFAYSSPT